MTTLDQAQTNIRRWREDPRLFVREVLHATPDPWQDEVLAAFPHHNRIAEIACKGPGKSACDSWLGWNFLTTRPHPKVVATSITGDNLRDGLWAEMAKWRSRAPLLRELFEWTHTRIFAKHHPETWFASARQWSKSADPGQQADTLAGIHADYVLFLIDEAGGVPDSVASAAEAALATGIETKLVISGNPTALSGPLYRAATTERRLWFVVHITGDPDDPKRSPRVDAQWAREQIEKHGPEHPFVLVNVFGRFPPGQSNALIGVNEVNDALRRTLAESAFMHEPRVLGVDVARFGDDRTVIFPRQGLMAMRPRVLRELDGMQVASQVVMSIRKWKPHAVFIDGNGNGSGVVDRVRQLGFDVVEVQAGAAAKDRAQFVNRRVEMWSAMADWVRRGGCLPTVPEIVGELTAPVYWFDSRNRMHLESKDDLKERGLSSPDHADALAHTFWEPVAPPELMASGAEVNRQRTVHEYDPFGEARV